MGRWFAAFLPGLRLARLRCDARRVGAVRVKVRVRLTLTLTRTLTLTLTRWERKAGPLNPASSAEHSRLGTAAEVTLTLTLALP